MLAAACKFSQSMQASDHLQDQRTLRNIPRLFSENFVGLVPRSSTKKKPRRSPKKNLQEKKTSETTPKAISKNKRSPRSSGLRSLVDLWRTPNWRSSILNMKMFSESFWSSIFDQKMFFKNGSPIDLGDRQISVLWSLVDLQDSQNKRSPIF